MILRRTFFKGIIGAVIASSFIGSHEIYEPVVSEALGIHKVRVRITECMECEGIRTFLKNYKDVILAS